MLQFLIVYCFNIVLRISGTILSSLLLYVSWKTGIVKQGSLLLVHVLIVYDLSNFILGAAHSIFLVSNWNPDGVDYDPYIFFFTNIPMLIHDKGEIVLLIGIAFDRILAVFIPTYYKYLNHCIKAIVITVLAVCGGLVDLVLFLTISGIRNRPNCGAQVCFMEAQNKRTMGMSNAILGLILLCLTIIFLLKLRLLKKSQTNDHRNKEANRFARANRMALISLTFSGLLIIVPSALIGAYQDISDAVFKSVGPVLSSLFLLAGIINSLTLLLRNSEINKGLRSLWRHSTITVEGGSQTGRKVEIGL